MYTVWGPARATTAATNGTAAGTDAATWSCTTNAGGGGAAGNGRVHVLRPAVLSARLYDFVCHEHVFCGAGM